MGPFSHFSFCKEVWPELCEKLELGGNQADELWPLFLAGAVAHDGGYYPGGDSGMSFAVHLLKPWQVCDQMLNKAATTQERVFALGWAAHALLDLRTHRELVNPLCQGPYAQATLMHKRIEWGLDAWFLSQPQGGWLWSVELEYLPAMGLWRRVLKEVYGVVVPRAQIEMAMQAQIRQVGRLPYAFWLSGQIRRKGHVLGNVGGWLLGRTVRPLYLAWLGRTGDNLDAIAVLSVRLPKVQDLALLRHLFQQTWQELALIMSGGGWPQGTLDADEEENGNEPGMQKAWLWLDSLR